jgi:hypothetical protein
MPTNGLHLHKKTVKTVVARFLLNDGSLQMGYIFIKNVETVTASFSLE